MMTSLPARTRSAAYLSQKMQEELQRRTCSTIFAILGNDGKPSGVVTMLVPALMTRCRSVRIIDQRDTDPLRLRDVFSRTNENLFHCFWNCTTQLYRAPTDTEVKSRNPSNRRGDVVSR
jgi:hypothetical protein